MDFSSMNRSLLQSFCKEYKIPANLKSTEMARRLTLLFDGKDFGGCVRYIGVKRRRLLQALCKMHCIPGNIKTAEMIERLALLGNSETGDCVPDTTASGSPLVEPGVAEPDEGEIFDGPVEVMRSENTMDAGDGKEILEKCDQHAEQSILEALVSDVASPLSSFGMKGHIKEDQSCRLEISGLVMSPFAASNHENEALKLVATSPILNRFEMKGLCRDDQTSGLNKSGLETSKCISKSEHEDSKNLRECIDNSPEMEEVLGLMKSTDGTINHCHSSPALKDTNVCIPSSWNDSESEPCTDNPRAKAQTFSSGAFALVLNAFPSCGNLCGLKEYHESYSENEKEKVSTDARLGDQPTEKLRDLQDLEADTTVGLMVMKQEADANSLLSFDYTMSSGKVVGSSNINMAAQIAGIDVSNLRLNETSSHKDSSTEEQSKCSHDIGGDFGNEHLSVHEDNDSICWKRRVLDLKFKGINAGVDGFSDTPDSGSKHGMLESVSAENVDEGLETAVYSSEEENRAQNSKENGDMLDLFGTLATCSAYSSEPSRLKPEIGAADCPSDSPVAASDDEDMNLEMEVASPFLNSYEIKSHHIDDHTSGLEQSGLQILKGISRTKYIKEVDEGIDKDICGSEKENHTLNSAVTGEIRDLHNIVGTFVTCSAHSPDASMLKPEIGADFSTSSPVIAYHENKGLELQVTSNSIEMKGLFENAQSSQLKRSGPEMSKDKARAEDKETVGNSLVGEEHEEQTAFLTDSPVTAYLGNKGLELEVVTSPFSNSFGMKGLFEDAPTSRLNKLSLEISKDISKMEVIEDLKENVSGGNSLVGEELHHEEQTAFPTDSPFTAHQENKSLQLDVSSPFSNSFGMKGLFQHDQTSRIKNSGPEMSKEKSKIEVIEYLKDKESFGNPLVGEELRHEEQTAFLTESPVTGYHENEGIDLKVTSPFSNSFGMKGLFEDAPTSRLNKSSLEMSKDISKMEVIEDLKEKESVSNLLVGEELHHEEQTAFPTDSPVTAHHENKSLQLDVSSPFSNSFGMKGLFQHEQTSRIKSSGPDISKDKAKTEDEETVGNSLVGEEHEEQIAFLTDSPVTAHHENEGIELKATSPFSNSFGMKRLLKDAPTSHLKNSGLKMSKDKSKTELIEDLKDKESVSYSLLGEELHHRELTVMGEVVEPNFTQEMCNHFPTGSALMDTDVHIPSSWDDSIEAEPCLHNACAKPQMCTGALIASDFDVSSSLGDLRAIKECSEASSEDMEEQKKRRRLMLVSENT